MLLENKSIVITGADGFIGSHLCEALAAAGNSVRALVMYNSFGSRGWLDQAEPELVNKLDIVAGDIRDPHRMQTLLDDQQIVFHLASLIGIPYSYHSPDSYIDTNVKGTLNLLQAARLAGVERFVHTSTSEIYGSAQYVPIDEKHPQAAQSPYAASKIAADQLALSFYRSFELPVTVIRPFNTYGPRQSARAVIPTIITQILSEATEIKLGSLKPKRDFSFVSDIVAGFIAAGSKPGLDGEVINIGSGEDISIGDLVKTIASLMKRSIKIVSDSERIRPAGSEVDRLLCDCSCAEKLLDFKSSVSLEDGLRRTIDWFSDKQDLAGYRPDQYNI